ncbi:MAG: tetratricopeptide repeat protein [Bacteroidales bacterium]|nr:MAG: tetratricopeptide repeat protein [Bacteroidales bacterium]
MKKINNLASLILAVLVLSGCGGLNKMKQNAGDISYNVEPEILETHAGEINVTITGTFPEKYFNKKAVVEATPVLVYEGGETAFESVTLQGESVEANNEVINFTGDKFTYSSKVAYNESMRVSELMLRAKASLKQNSVDFDPVKLADGVISTSTYVYKHGEPIMMKDNFQKVIPKSKMADIHYLINVANVRGSELRAEDIEELREFIKTANEEGNVKFSGTAISAYASPDGEYDFNDNLSQKRSVTAETFVDRELKRAQVEEATAEGFIAKKATPEDWEGFQELMEKSDIEDKELILRVLSMHSDPVVREREIKNIAAAYKIIADDILPQLRRSMITVNVDVIGFSDEEILEYFESNPDTLGLEECLYGATLVGKDFEKQLGFYKLAVEKNQDCIRAHNNVGYAYMYLGNIPEAKAAFERAKALRDIDLVKNNLGYVALLEGDLEQAKTIFTSLESPTDESKYGLGIISIVEGNYQEAITYFGTKPSYNLALAKLLIDDVSGAKSTIDAVEMENEWVFYLKAIVGANLQDEDYMFNNLRSSVGMNAEMKEMAKTDLEFFRYFENDTFKSIVE